MQKDTLQGMKYEIFCTKSTSVCEHIEILYSSEYQTWLSKLAEAEATNMRLKAIIRKAEMRVEKLEHELGQKNKENSELHNLCDELIQSSSRKSSRQEPL